VNPPIALTAKHNPFSGPESLGDTSKLRRIRSGPQ
jgi:hypothetical protein